METGIKVLEYLPSLEKLFELQQKIAFIHPYLEKLFPVAVVMDKEFVIYDFHPESQSYRFVKKAPIPLFIPEGVRAAFPLPFYEDRMACVITADAFDTLEGYVLIFHEFIHCQQWESGEMDLKRTLGVYKKARQTKDDQWEIDYPFPYTDPEFTRLYNRFLQVVVQGKAEDIAQVRKQLAALLKKPDYEYMVWQEWKEGFARTIENRIRKVLDLPGNHYGAEEPFNRIVFYEGGSRYIEFLEKQNLDNLVRPETLFKDILTAAKP